MIGCYLVSSSIASCFHNRGVLNHRFPRIRTAQFRMSSHQDLEHHFKVISQYFIHLVVTGPNFTEESESSYFKTALEAFRRRFQGMKDSLITSSVWKPEFKKSLEVWPEFIIGHLDEAVMGCDACHLSGRMSKYEGRLEGRAYDPETFEVRQLSKAVRIVFVRALTRDLLANR
jgi:hypothetical protein